MTAAYALRDRSTLVLEHEPRVGGRTLSGGDVRAWYNLGAQLVTSPRLVALCQELGIGLNSVSEADYAMSLWGKAARGASPERLLIRMNLSAADKANFGIAALRLRRALRKIQSYDDSQKAQLDRRSLLDVIGRVSPRIASIFALLCENSTGSQPQHMSGLYGLGYSLAPYIDPDSKAGIYGVRGGTQQIAKAMRKRLAPDSVRLACRVTSVRNEGRHAKVTYLCDSGDETSVLAEQCICALPAQAVLDVVEELPAEKRAALRRLTPYPNIVSVAWPVRDGEVAPWDQFFIMPVVGHESFGLLTNYGYLAKQQNPSLGGYINTMANGIKADLLRDIPDGDVVDMQFANLTRLFPGADAILDRSGAVVHRWASGLPRIQPGYFTDRLVLRHRHGRIHFCGDYTAEPGLAGANGSAHYVAQQVAGHLDDVDQATSCADRQRPMST